MAQQKLQSDAEMFVIDESHGMPAEQIGWYAVRDVDHNEVVAVFRFPVYAHHFVYAFNHGYFTD